MKYFQFFIKKPDFIFQIKPQKPVPFQAKAIGTQRIFPGFESPVGEKRAIMMTTYRTLYFRTPVEEACHLQKTVVE